MFVLLAAVATAAIGLIPSLTVSNRRRLLRTLRDESAVYESLTDDVTKERLREALRKTAAAYRDRASVDHDDLERSRRLVRRVSFGWGTVLLIFLYARLNGFDAQTVGVSDDDFDHVQSVAATFVGLVQTALLGRFLWLARQRERSQ